MRALTIAGSDPSGGGGIQRDLKTFAASGVEGLSVVASLTAQNTTGVAATVPVAGAFIVRQIEELLADTPPRASKTGLLPTAEAVAAVASCASRLGPLVVDPVFGSTGGQHLVADEVPEAVRMTLFPKAAVVTPNLAEASALVGFPVENAESMVAAGRELLKTGAGAVLIKGGHLHGDPLDLLFTDQGVEDFAEVRIEVPDVRGTGCALSAALAANLAKGLVLREAVVLARRFVRESLAAAAPAGRGAWHLGSGT